MARATRTVVIYIGALVAVLAAAATIVIVRPAYTPRIDGAHPVAELRELRLGGYPQWVLIRGADDRNPIILFLHGGPGMPTMYLAHAFQGPLEQRFVVAQWDRLGAGKSYAPGIPLDSMRVSREVSDTGELIEYLLRRFHKHKLYLVGFSYGSYLGMLVAHQYPSLLHAYVGIGQLGCSEAEDDRYQRAWIRRRASAEHNRVALAQLDSNSHLDLERWLFAFGGEDRQMTSYLPILWIGLTAPEYRLSDALNVPKGVSFTHANLKFDVIGDNSLMSAVKNVDVPIYFFTGRYDETDPQECTTVYFNQLRAPYKQLVWFNTAHFVFLEEPRRFAAAMEAVAAVQH